MSLNNSASALEQAASLGRGSELLNKALIAFARDVKREVRDLEDKISSLEREVQSLTHEVQRLSR